MDLFMKNQLKSDVYVDFAKSVSSAPSTSSLSRATWQRSLQQVLKDLLMATSDDSLLYRAAIPKAL